MMKCRIEAKEDGLNTDLIYEVLSVVEEIMARLPG